MKKLFSYLAAVFFVAALTLWFVSTSYRLSATLLALPAIYFAFMAYSEGRDKKILVVFRRTLTVLAIFGVVSTATLCTIVLTEVGGDADAACDYVIVLGAGLKKDIPTRTLVDRLEKAREYLTLYPDSVAIVSGSQGKKETVPESYAMKKYLVDNGIDGERIIEEANADNTHENMKFSSAIINRRGGGSIAVITSDYHIFRSRRLAENAGFSPLMLSAKTSSLPVFVNSFLREAFALIKAYLVFI